MSTMEGRSLRVQGVMMKGGILGIENSDWNYEINMRNEVLEFQAINFKVNGTGKNEINTYCLKEFHDPKIAVSVAE